MQVLLIYIFMKSSPIDHLLVRESLRGFVADAGGARLTSASPFRVSDNMVHHPKPAAYISPRGCASVQVYTQELEDSSLN